ncbi:hypothetical protein [Lentzea sp. E54]|uniref:hypothetical protein n=1 Tax=Lentzea xerophila TaxID=3435883 RepID=UPI003DA42A8E
MYTWIWRALPGSVVVRALLCAALVVGVLALLWFWGFPLIDRLLPFDDVTVS